MDRTPDDRTLDARALTALGLDPDSPRAERLARPADRDVLTAHLRTPPPPSTTELATTVALTIAVLVAFALIIATYLP